MTLADYLKSENVKPGHLAALLAVSPSTITRLATGERVPSLKLAKRIAAATDGRVTPYDFGTVEPDHASGAAA